jgi:FkbM family methyltransferase
MLKEKFQKLFRLVGLEVNKYSFYNSEHALLKKCLDLFSINFVIDVGANAGQYGTKLREAGYNFHISSFEPLEKSFLELKIKAAKYKDWYVYNFAAGSKHEELMINVSENLVSSSLLGMTTFSKQAEPKSQYYTKQKIKVIPLEGFFHDKGINGKNIFLKMDVQGYELEVLKGYDSLLSKTSVVQLEMSFVPLYESGPLYDTIFSFFKERNFEVYTIIPGFRDPQTGRMLQADGIFINKAKL